MFPQGLKPSSFRPGAARLKAVPYPQPSMRWPLVILQIGQATQLRFQWGREPA